MTVQNQTLADLERVDMCLEDVSNFYRTLVKWRDKFSTMYQNTREWDYPGDPDCLYGELVEGCEDVIHLLIRFMVWCNSNQQGENDE